MYVRPGERCYVDYINRLLKILILNTANGRGPHPSCRELMYIVHDDQKLSRAHCCKTAVGAARNVRVPQERHCYSTPEINEAVAQAVQSLERQQVALSSHETTRKLTHTHTQQVVRHIRPTTGLIGRVELSSCRRLRYESLLCISACGCGMPREKNVVSQEERARQRNARS